MLYVHCTIFYRILAPQQITFHHNDDLGILPHTLINILLFILSNSSLSYLISSVSVLSVGLVAAVDHAVIHRIAAPVAKG